MLRFVKVTCFFLFVSQISFSQNCNYAISGKIVDELTNEPLAYAAVFIEETQQGVSADEDGNYRIMDICQTNVHIRVTHVSCEPVRKYVDLSTSKTLNFELHHHTELLNELQVHGNSSEKSSQANSSIGAVEIAKTGNQNLADILEQLTGVSAIKNGSGISKPVIHGLFGNRISILNNGIAQSGQQWGTDHAPEIDPFSADHLTVIKGVSALAYNGSTLGGVVLVESKPIQNEPHLHGSVNYLYNSNGRGNTLNAKIEKAGKWLKWRANGTLKIQGDTRTPDYYLTNTARREANVAVRLEKRINQRWNSILNYSNFNTEIGILRGSQIGNLTDLNLALNREIPFFTEDNFNYKINEPKQRVNHQLLKLEFNGLISTDQTLRFTYGGQLNNRKEYDVRRGDRSEKPVLSLNQWSHLFEGKYTKDFKHGSTFSVGLQETITDNTNVPETGINPLIPDYLSYHTALFGIFTKQHKNWFHEVGGRLENKQLNVVRITRSVPKTLERINQNFTFFSLSAGSQLTLPKRFALSGNIGIAMRPPEVNELYSFGLHQGVSSIEEGNELLKSEQSIKALFSASYHAKKYLFFEITPYVQRISNFIFLQPQPDFLLTIRGAFPYFRFQQTEALLVGTDALFSIEPTENVKIITKYSFVRGNDLTNNSPLIFIPPTTISSGLNIGFRDLGKLSNNALEIEVAHTAKQHRLQPEQDFMPPPDGFTLLNFSANTNLKIGKNYVSMGLKATNLLNVRYRSYLNRLRYFADDIGRNVIISTQFVF